MIVDIRTAVRLLVIGHGLIMCLSASHSLCESFAHFTILDSGCNNSHHNPITWQLNWSDVHNVTHKQQQHHHSPQMCWDKADIGLYYSSTGQLLQAINVPAQHMYLLILRTASPALNVSIMTLLTL